MPSVCFYFQVHQPYRLKQYTFFDIGHHHDYENEEENRAILQKVSDKCYLPANTIIRDLIRRHHGRFRVAFSISGIVLDQFIRYQPAVLKSFQDLAATGCVEFLSETYFHSLSFLFSEEEFRHQVELHRKKIQKLFGQTPHVFRNTELIYNNDLARMIEAMGYQAILAEGADHILGWRSPNLIYKPQGCRRLKLLLKNYRLADDIAFRFSNTAWPEYPLTAQKYASWLHQLQKTSDVINLFMDYETFGEHQWADSGIFDFLEELPGEVLRNPDYHFATPSEAATACSPSAVLDIPQFTSWADMERDLSAWLGNDMQRDAIHALYGLERKMSQSNDKYLLQDWRLLQTSDHFYYMCTKWFADGDIHKYFNPYKSPYDAYINYMNILSDLTQRLNKHTKTTSSRTHSLRKVKPKK